MKLIFLDIDGVIVLPVPGRKTLFPSRACIEQLNRITDATGAKLVISSGRRFDPDLEATLAEWGVRGPIIGRTPVVGDGMGGRRGEEIEQWLAACAEPIKEYVILDDAEDSVPMRQFLLQTTFEQGLTEEIATAAIARLR